MGIKEKEAMAKRIEAESNMERGIDNPAGDFSEFSDIIDEKKNGSNGNGNGSSSGNGSTGDDDEIDAEKKKKKEAEAEDEFDDDEPVDMTPKLDVYYIVMAILLGMIIIGILLYFAVTTFGKQQTPEVDWQNITIVEKKVGGAQNVTELWDVVTNETMVTTEGTTEYDYYL